MSKTISLTYCGMEGSGPTVREAKQEAARKIERAITGTYAPLLIPCRNAMAIVYREPAGWCYRIVEPSTLTKMTHIYGSYSSDPTMENAIRNARKHLALWTWTISDGKSIPENIILDSFDKRDFLGWAEWHLRFDYFKNAGNDEEECRRKASDYSIQAI